MHDDVLERLFGELAAADLPVPSPAAVVARGRRRRRRARMQVLAGIAAAGALTGLAVSALSGTHAPAQSPAGRHAQALAVCSAAPDPALAAELRSAMPTAGQTGVTVIALSPDSSTAYVLTTTTGFHVFHGIAEESVATGAILRTIEALPVSDDGAIGGLDSDGDLIWYNVHSGYGGENGDTTPMQRWSPRTGTVTDLEPAGQHSGALSAPAFSGAGRALAAWEQADGTAHEIVVANLRTGVTDVVARGPLAAPAFVGDALVWPAGRAPHLIAVRTDSLPEEVFVGYSAPLRAAGAVRNRGAGGVSYIASAGGQTAYFSADLTKLFYSPGPAVPARLVLKLPRGDTFGAGPPALGPGYLGWGTASAASYVASTSSLAAVALTNGRGTYGDVQAAGSFVVAASSRDPKHGSWRLSVLSGATINRLVCAPAGTAGR